MKRVAIYARSSPDCPLTADEQIKRLTTVAAERGWTVAHVFADRPTAVKKDQDRRSGELALIEAIRSGADRQSIGLVHRPNWEITGRSGQVHGDMPLCLRRRVFARARELIPRPRMDCRCSMCPRMMAHHLRQSRRDRILRGQAAARAVCRSDLAGHRSPSRRWRRPSSSWRQARACDRSPEWQGFPLRRFPESRPR